MSLKKLIGTALRRGGYQAVPLDILSDLGLCTHLKTLFETQGIDTVFDVGANRGQYCRLLRKGIGFKGTVLSFEPLSELREHLMRESKHDPNWHVFPFALGKEAGQLSINVMKARTMSSLLAPDSRHTDRFIESNVPVGTELVTVKCLDDIYGELCEQHRFTRPYLKLDTQGFDLNIVNGGQKVISDFVALQIEASVLPAYKGMPGYRESIDALNHLGFELSGVYPVTKDERLRLIEFDCVMVNTGKITLVPADLH